VVTKKAPGQSGTSGQSGSEKTFLEKLKIIFNWPIPISPKV
jgi:hypothetical protein